VVSALALVVVTGCGVDAGSGADTDVGAANSTSVAAAEAAVPENPLKDAYFGETHVHTSYSLDAYIGGARLTPSDAYGFAKGADVEINGTRHNIVKPLDFAAVSDHAEYLGEMHATQVPGVEGYDHPLLDELRNLQTVEEQRVWYLREVVGNSRGGDPEHTEFYPGDAVFESGWRVLVDAAAEHYEPGRFTTLVGFEWTGVQEGGNMHRNVLFRDTIVPDVPLSSIDTTDEEELWAWMAAQDAAGSTLLAIPHNSNGSKGKMFETVDNAGNPLTAEYARNRAEWEPLIEMMQIKGNSEVVASLWPEDEFADFENAVSLQNFSDRAYRRENFVRYAVIKGLDYADRLGANPYQLGFIGGTDNHNGAPSDVVEDNYIGSHGPTDGSLEERRQGEIDGWLLSSESNPGSLAGVWATRNTRGAIWDAMKARETFVTSGTRIKPRFFCGMGLASEAPGTGALAEAGYADGVPMGGTMTSGEGAPTCWVHALKDPDGANLDRIQIIKGWVDAQGEPQERIIDVVWSGDRIRGADGSLPAVGNTVHLETAEYTNDIGSPELTGAWTDDDFDPDQHAVYYVRVLEIPTPRFTTYDAVRNGLPLLDNVPATIQERAWTSPIWYSPDPGEQE
jgi:hypothetical protein